MFTKTALFLPDVETFMTKIMLQVKYFISRQNQTYNCYYCYFPEVGLHIIHRELTCSGQTSWEMQFPSTSIITIITRCLPILTQEKFFQ